MTPASGELLELGLRAAREAAELVRERRAAGVSVAATKSSEVDIVTQADRDSEALIRSLLLGERPDDALLGEEDDDVPGSTGVRWIIDPIDGTVNFLYGLPEFAISIAAEVAGVVVAGVVLNVATGQEWAAARTADGFDVSAPYPLGVRASAPLAQQLLLTGFSYDAHLRELQARALVTLLPRVRDIRRHGSAALELCKIACGQADAYVEVGVNLWDYAAGALVAEAAGARWEVLPGLAGRDLMVCAPRAGFEELRAAVLAAGLGGE